jgi:hypothetical protein
VQAIPIAATRPSNFHRMSEGVKIKQATVKVLSVTMHIIQLLSGKQLSLGIS